MADADSEVVEVSDAELVTVCVSVAEGVGGGLTVKEEGSETLEDKDEVKEPLLLELIDWVFVGDTEALGE